MPSGKGHSVSKKRRMNPSKKKDKKWRFTTSSTSRVDDVCLWSFGWTVLRTVSKLSDVFRRTRNGSSSQISQTSLKTTNGLLVGDTQRTECRCQGNDILGVELIF